MALRDIYDLYVAKNGNEFDTPVLETSLSQLGEKKTAFQKDNI